MKKQFGSGQRLNELARLIFGHRCFSLPPKLPMVFSFQPFRRYQLMWAPSNAAQTLSIPSKTSRHVSSNPARGGGKDEEGRAIFWPFPEDPGGADGGGHGGQIPRLAPACPEQHHTEHTEGAEDLTELPGGKAAEPGIEPGRAVEEEVGEHRQHRDRKTVAQAPLGHSA